ncbi:MAG: hypothetical protein COV31_02100 [Candidatus Yanofskybacteria bacterium CG10_big_fil_rev_8_21_14_0_10_46_23]|uniref:TVP38/TMEM64 family membrane protein n=1 Tax=Candidatus Yanofskybacteria bacterium CG10_big_fil_rev_8_21_14_0_10_46_23 TaxID=1975098 RepID=A0A2H0R3T7_9BACT|nr:MAG: hypothetical protein COV31_02100 [Candidatus Yanofskybacteria bacterium CG10_big_fil_rev_8_21_14_0_10_46_23]
MTLQKKEILVKALLAIALAIFLVDVFLPDVTSDSFQESVRQAGVWGPAVVIAYTILAHVFAPLVGSPVVFVSVAVFGIGEAFLYLYIASLISATINFYISRKLGRIWVRRLAGREGLEGMDKFLSVATTKILVIARLLGFSLFDFISYAAGLTKISFRKYFVITAVFAVIPMSIFAFLFKDFDFSSKVNFLFWLGLIILAGAIFSLTLKRNLENRIKTEEDL